MLSIFLGTPVPVRLRGWDWAEGIAYASQNAKQKVVQKQKAPLMISECHGMLLRFLV